MDPKSFIENHKDRLLSELFELLRIPSISADPSFNDDVAKCASAIEGHMHAIGLQNVEIYPTSGHPKVEVKKTTDNTNRHQDLIRNSRSRSERRTSR